MSELIELPIKHREPTQHKTLFIPSGERFLAVVGATGTGKTTWVCNKFVPNLAQIGIAYICSSDIFQEAYSDLATYLESKGTQVMKRNSIDPAEIQELAPVFKSHKHNLFVFDDYRRDELEGVVTLAKMGRHSHNCSLIYITHMFAKELPQEVRANLNCIALFQTPDVDMVAREALGDPRKIKKFVKEVTAEAYMPVTFWRDGQLDPAMRIRRGLRGILKTEIPPDVAIAQQQRDIQSVND